MEEFENSHHESKDLKLLVDFKDIDVEFKGKQMEIECIKYKSKKVNKNLKKEEVDLKNRKSKGKSLF